MKCGIFIVFLANALNMCFSLIVNFALPKYLPVDTYSGIKLFQLYCSYASLFSLGYIDGMFVKYGGRDFTGLEPDDLACNLSTFRLFQLLAMIPGIIFSLFLNDTIFLMFCLAVLPLNMLNYFKNMFQSVGEFHQYCRITNMSSISLFAANMFLLFAVRTDNSAGYIVTYVFVDIFVWLIMEYLFFRLAGGTIRLIYFSVRELAYNIKEGILLSLGYLSSVFLTGMDRWFIKVLMGSPEFAFYSFAVSVENMLNVAVTPITVTLYHYVCKIEEEEKIVKLKNLIILFSTVLVSSAFPVKLILETCLTKYLESVNILFFLFASQIFYIIVKSVFVNLYKAKHMQAKYFTKLVLVIMIGFFLNVVCYSFWKSKEAFSLGTLLTAVIWFILCQFDFEYLRFKWNEIMYLTISTCGFIAIGTSLRAVPGFFAYIGLLLFTAPVFMKKEVFAFKSALAEFMNKKTDGFRN